MTIDEYEWLSAAKTLPLIDQVASELDGGRTPPSAALVERLRREMTVSQASAILQQVALRWRAARKFSRASEMFFTPVLLEQSTSESIASYKATLFAKGPIIDLCCGIGGDSIGMSAQGINVTVVDRNEVATRIASHNTTAYARSETVVSQLHSDAKTAPVEDFSAWHIDPDRRPDGSRTTHVAAHEPGLDVLNNLLTRNPNAAIKLAPATDLPDEWLGSCQREWIGEQRECKQQLIRFGTLVSGELASNANRHTATIVDSDGQHAGSVHGEFDQPVEYTPVAADFIYEPHAAVRAAGLTGALANQLGLKRIGLATSYMTGEAVPTNATFTGFRVLSSMPFDRKRVKQRIRELGLGQLEIKTRGLKLEPAQEQKRLSAKDGGRPGCVFLFSAEEKSVALLTERIT